jgi:hypothetical protein
MTTGSCFLYDALFNIRYHMAFFIFSDVLQWQGLRLLRWCMSCSHCGYTVHNTCKKLKWKFGKKLLLLWNSENEWNFHELRAKSLNSSNRCEDLGLIIWKESSRYWEWDTLAVITVALFNPSYMSSYHCILLLNYCNGVYQLEITEFNNVMLSSYISTVAYHILITDS